MVEHKNSKAIFIAPLIVPVIVFFILLFSGGSVLLSAFTALPTWIVSYLGFAVFIMPLLKYQRAKRQQNLRPLLVSGMAGGALLVSIISLLLACFGALEAIAVGAFFGSSVAIASYFLSGMARFMPTDLSSSDLIK